jgi:hypothetical protein
MRIVRASDRRELWTGEFQETVRGAALTSDAAGFGRLREEFTTGNGSLATRIVEALTNGPIEPPVGGDALNW